MTGYHTNTARPNSHIAHIDAVNALALLRYRRAKDAGASLEGAASALTALPTLLRHLREEVNDEESPLNREGDRLGVSSHLHPLIEETNLVLHEFGEVLELEDEVYKEGYSSKYKVEELDRQTRRIERRLVRQKSKIKDFLDYIQLRSTPPPIPPKVPIGDDNLDRIEDKLDVIASKLFRRRRSNLGETEDDLWEQFSVELEKEGFDRNKLRKNKEILRAYVRSLETSALDQNGREPPSVRGLLQQELHELPASPVESPHSQHFYSVPKASTFPVDDQKPPPSPPMSNNEPCMSPCLPKHLSTGLLLDNSGDDSTSSSSTSEVDSMALISTQDLLELDRKEHFHNSLISPMSSPNLSPPHQFSQAFFSNNILSLGSSPRPYLPASSSPLALPSSPTANSFKEQPTTYYRIPPEGTSPALLQAPPSPATAASGSDELATLPKLHSRLSPDSFGRQIPMEANWTKIKRSLVSPQVLEEAGVRYEARPTFVAILGVLPREKVAELARKTAEVRASRNPRVRRSRTHEDETYRAEQKERRLRERQRNEKRWRKQNDIWDESDTSTDYSESSGDKDRMPSANESRRRVYSSGNGAKDSGPRSSSLFIVTPSSEEKTSPTATTAPKPILKNKNENHVHFGRDGPFEVPVSATESPREERVRRGCERGSERERERERERDQNRRDRNRDRDKYRDKERDRERDRDSRNRERDSRDNRYPHSYKDRVRDRERERRQKHSELIRAAGIGGAAASLLSVLAEAAVGM